MSDTFALVLRDAPEPTRLAVAQFLGRAFGLKDATAEAVASSSPIALLTELTRDEAAAMALAMGALQRIPTVKIDFTDKTTDDLPKIDWPRRPLIFKREIADYAADMQMALPCPDCGKPHALGMLLGAKVSPERAASKPNLKAVVAAEEPAIAIAAAKNTPPPAARSQEFKGAKMPEITPFFNQALPNPTASGASPIQPASDDAATVLNNLFPDDSDAPGGGFIPDNNNITNLLDRLLPDEEEAPAAAGENTRAAPGIAINAPQSGFSVFLAKIGDEPRRKKAVPVLVELAHISNEEAEALSKKVIIPVIKGVSKEEAEAAKQRFAKIGILARIKGAADTAG